MRIVSAHSSATGMSLVPALTSTTRELESGGIGDFSSVHVRAIALCFIAGISRSTALAFSSSIRVTSTFCPVRASSLAIPTICSGVFPSPRMTSGTP